MGSSVGVGMMVGVSVGVNVTVACGATVALGIVTLAHEVKKIDKSKRQAIRFIIFPPYGI